MKSWDKDHPKDYPVVGYYFSVSISGSYQDTNAAFAEVRGIGVEMEYEDYREGGKGGPVIKLPSMPRYPNLVLRRGIIPESSAFGDWVRQVMISNYDLGNVIEPQTITVSLLNPEGEPSMAWTFYSAYLIKWSLDELSSTRNEILMEELEIAYSYFTEK